MASFVIRHFNEQLKYRELLTRLQLENENNTREQIINQKTKEAIQLSSLTKQFSPQVVHAIRSGQLEGLNGIRRSNICSIFIDIVNSTDRVVRIDKDALNKVLTQFMEDTMKTLLKYDITIDKFLGDGVLAFSNAPIQHNDYVDRVLNAALEIRSRIAANREFYIEHWLNELEIRIGISSGYANVGFYGSTDYFNSYTAIGKVINLSSRLTGAATANQILVSQDVLRSMNNSDQFKFKEVGYQKLKGFEADIIKTYELLESKASSTIANAIDSCPQGHGILHLDTNALGHYVFTCRTCGFEQGDPSQSTTAAKPINQAA